MHLNFYHQSSSTKQVLFNLLSLNYVAPQKPFWTHYRITVDPWTQVALYGQNYWAESLNLWLQVFLLLLPRGYKIKLIQCGLPSHLWRNESFKEVTEFGWGTANRMPPSQQVSLWIFFPRRYSTANCTWHFCKVEAFRNHSRVNPLALTSAQKCTRSFMRSISMAVQLLWV